VQFYLQSSDAALCNRLDVNTSGLTVCGKTFTAIKALNTLFAQRNVEKEYIAVVHGQLIGRRTLQGYFFKDTNTNTAAVLNEGDAEVITEYEAISATPLYSYARIRPITGRSHQIRAHLASAGHPLAGDKKYGGKATSYAPAQLLHSHRLTLKESGGLPYPPKTCWEANPPGGFNDCLKALFNIK
jgi:23S rRNA pseudouridine955/2504/2580 synthase